jgi:pimeloyl-ACP methyl ester carboxylesterase
MMTVACILLSACSNSNKRSLLNGEAGRYITILNTRIYYEEYGDGTPLVLLQGGMGSISDFEKCIPELARHYRVIAPDTPGQGRSELADSMSYQLLAHYMSLFLDSLQLPSAHIMGWSDGGIIGLLLAAQRPDKVKSVVSAGVNYRGKDALRPDVDPSRANPEPAEIWQTKNRKWIDQYVKTLPRDWRKFRTDLVNMWFADEYFPKSTLEQINVPVMIVMGDRDEITFEHCIEMHRLIKNSHFCVLPNTSHAVFREKPEIITQLALDFFGE